MRLPGRWWFAERIVQLILALYRKELRLCQALLDPVGLRLLLHPAQPGLTPGHHADDLAVLRSGEA